MSGPKIKVPKEIDYAVENAIGYHRPDLAERNIPEIARIASFAFAKAMAENPIVPTDPVIRELLEYGYANIAGDVPQARYHMTEWQSRMFAPEPEYIGGEELGQFCARFQRIDDAVLEAYRRGQQSNS